MIGATGAGAGAGVGFLAGVRASVGGSGSRAFWALVRTPGAGSQACRVNSSFSRDRICSSKESWRTPTVGLGDTSSKSALAEPLQCKYVLGMKKYHDIVSLKMSQRMSARLYIICSVYRSAG